MPEACISLSRLFPAARFVGCQDITVANACADSRHVQPGDTFVAIAGCKIDGHQMIEQAVSAGAAALVVNRPLSHITIPQCVVSDTRIAWSQLCLAMRGMPQHSVTTAGITGTNGKTTTAWILRSILRGAGRQTGMLGTIEYDDGCHVSTADLTTPDAQRISHHFERMVSLGTTHCVMEISSHALDQQRCAGLSLATATITNITQDHFDYHGHFEAYARAKISIQQLLKPTAALLLGIDDPGCQFAYRQLTGECPLLTFGFCRDAQLQVSISSKGHAGCEAAFSSDDHWIRQHLELRLLGSTISAETGLIGRHNALNCLAAAAMAEQLSVSPDQITAGIRRVRFVPGRLQSISAGQPFQVFVDFAHTPDAVANCLQTVRAVTGGDLICVFGAGGDRDRAKRPLMGKAARAADQVIITSDNPRSESPLQIMRDIAVGVSASASVSLIEDRAEAIRYAISVARPQDSIVIAGRGHETRQQFADHNTEFCDATIAAGLLESYLNQRARIDTK